MLARGDVIYIYTDGKHAAQLVQLPEAQAALVSLDPTDGASPRWSAASITSRNKYNRAVQAKRQPGSSFKPFLYSSALENGFTAASVLPDAPIVIEGSGMETAWRPKNSHGTFNGPTRLREALAKSLNLVSIRLLRQLGIDYAINYVTRFGFDKDSLPNNFTLALGTMQIAPIDLAGAYATFANGGFRVAPYYIDRIEDLSGKVLWQAESAHRLPAVRADRGSDARCRCRMPPMRRWRRRMPSAAAPGPLTTKQLAPRVISPQNDYIMTDMMADVIRHGTGRRALVLGRTDLAGKTGTTDEAKDAWFNGFNTRLVTTVWVGFDQERSLGESEEGARTALPIWIGYMREALKDVPQEKLPMPDGPGAAARLVADRHAGERRKSRRHARDLHGQSSAGQRHAANGQGSRPANRRPRAATPCSDRLIFRHRPDDWGMSKRLSVRGEHLRHALAQEAARVMAEHGIRDFLVAKRKAAERFGVTDGAVLPKNTEIERRWWNTSGCLAATRTPNPCMPSARGPACHAAAVRIRAAPGGFGVERHGDRTLGGAAASVRGATRGGDDLAAGSGHPARGDARRVKMNAERVLEYPGVRFEVDDQAIEATVFPTDGIRQAPVSPVDGKPMRRADVADVEALLAAG